MWKNNLKITLRSFRRNPLYTFINVAGLAIGIACSLLITLYIFNELSYDKHHPNTERVYRIVANDKGEDGSISELATTTAPLTSILGNFSELEEVVRFLPLQGFVKYKPADKQFLEEDFYLADSTFFNLFAYSFISGNPKTALEEPFSLVLTKTAANKYFGNEPALGKVVEFRDEEAIYEFKITGVIQDETANSHLDFDFLGSISSTRTIMPWYNNWHYPPLYTYILAKQSAQPQEIAAVLKNIPDQQPNYISRTYEAQPLPSIHLSSNREQELNPNSDSSYLWIFGAIGFFILLIACINFMNLTTATAIHRSKEVGVRQTMGAKKRQLIQQFMGESLVLTSVATVIAIGLLEVILPYFNTLFDLSLQADYTQLKLPLLLGATLLLVTGLAGAYPAFFLSSIKPVKALRSGDIQLGNTSNFVRKSLVVFQFFVSCGLIAVTMMMYNQLNFLQNKNLGIEKDHVITMPLRDQDNQINYDPIKQRWLQHPDVQNVTASSDIPGNSGLLEWDVYPRNAAIDSLQMRTLTVDHDFSETYNLEFIAGRDFSDAFTTDASEAFVLNERAVQKFGWSEDPIGQRIRLVYHSTAGAIPKEGKVIGVVKDFHYNALHKEVEPMLLQILPNSFYNNYLSVKINGQNVPQTLSFLEREWKAFNAEIPFEYTFLEETLDRFYRAERRLSTIFLFFAGLSIFIACLGLLGLVSLTVTNRTKEIGIRKVLGASVPSIVTLISKDFLRLIVIALLLSTPIAWFAINKWLNNFAYHIDMQWWIFAAAGLLTMLAALLTVSFQTIKAALLNPADSLKNE